MFRMLKIKNDENLYVIGISGYATSGKDTFAEIAKDILKSVPNSHSFILNLAADLKVIADLIIRPYLGIDCLNPSSEDKRRIRKILVGIGQGFRDVDEAFWINFYQLRHMVSIKRVEQKIIESSCKNQNNFVFIPDIRNFNECEWIKSFKKGFVISITRDGIVAPNEHELENIPIIASKYADFRVNIPNIVNDAKNILTNNDLRGIVKNILKEIYGRNIG